MVAELARILRVLSELKARSWSFDGQSVISPYHGQTLGKPSLQDAGKRAPIQELFLLVGLCGILN